MQRQSLGSPLHKDEVSLSKPTSSTSPQYDDVKLKPTKPRRLSISNSPFSHNLIHLMPLLTLFCFLLLYAYSHNPSPTDMALFRPTSSTNDVAEINDISKLTEVRRADIVAMGSMRSLREIIVADKPKWSRKLADF